MTTNMYCVPIYITIQTLNNELPEQPTCHPAGTVIIPQQFLYLNPVAGHPPEMKSMLHRNQWKVSSVWFTQPGFCLCFWINE